MNCGRRWWVASLLCWLAMGGTPVAGGEAGVKEDRGAYAEPALLTLPPAGESIIDPTFGTTILRVTDQRDGKSCTNAYSYWPTFNRDSTHFHIICDDTPTLYDFDPVRIRFSNKRPLFASKPPVAGRPNWEDSIWSGVDADVLLAHSQHQLWAYNVATDKYTLIKDFGKELVVGYLRQMSRSIDDQVFAFSTTDRSGNATGYIVWRRADDKVLLKKEEPLGLDEVQVDKSGKYLVIKTEKQGKGAVQARVADLQTGKIEDLTDNGPDFAPGHSDNGTGTVIGADNWENRYTLRSLDRPHEFRSVLDLKDDWSQDAHISLLADDEQWVLMTFYVGNKLKSSGPFRNEIVLVKMDGSQQVRRLAHHRSIYKDYWDSPRGDISRDGRFVAFTSTWGDTGRRDVFVLVVPPIPK